MKADLRFFERPSRWRMAGVHYSEKPMRTRRRHALVAAPEMSLPHPSVKEPAGYGTEIARNAGGRVLHHVRDAQIGEKAYGCVIEVPAHAGKRHARTRCKGHERERSTTSALDAPRLPRPQHAAAKRVLDDLYGAAPRDEPPQHAEQVVGSTPGKAGGAERRPRPARANRPEREREVREVLVRVVPLDLEAPLRNRAGHEGGTLGAHGVGVPAEQIADQAGSQHGVEPAVNGDDGIAPLGGPADDLR